MSAGQPIYEGDAFMPQQSPAEPAAPRLARRRYLFSPAMRREYPAAKAFLAPQREHVKQPMPSKARQS